MRKKGLAKVLLSFEAFFGSFYVAVSRGLFVPMLAYSGYLLDRVSTITFFAAVLNVVISYLIYYNPVIVSRNAKAKLLLFHIIERVIWTSLPFMLYSPDLLTITYGLAQSITIPVGVLLNVAMLDVFKDEEFVEISVLRSAVASAASLIGSLFTIYITILLDPPQSYYVAYVVSGLVGLLASFSLIPYSMSRDFTEEGIKKIPEEIEIRKVNTFLMLVLMLSGGNLLGLAWPQTLKLLGAPLYVTIALNLAGNIGGIVGPYLWRGYRSYVIAIAINTIFSASIPLITIPYGHIVISAILSATFIGANLIASSIYSRYVESLGIVRASTFLTSSNAVGLLTASLIGKYMPQNPFLIYGLAASLKALALLVVLIAIPETAVVPTKTAYGYGKLIYTASVLGYTFTVETSLKIFKIFLQVLALTTLALLLLFIYGVVIILTSGV